MAAEPKIKEVKDILFNSKLKIPYWQRKYDWDKEQIEQFLNDLLNFYEHYTPGNTYPMGTMMFIIDKNDEKTYKEVQDGQQRTTTFYILFFAIINYIKKHLQEETLKGQDKKIEYLTDLSNEWTTKLYSPSKKKPNLELQAYNQQIFLDIINDDVDHTKKFNKNLTDSNDKIESKYIYFMKNISKIFNQDTIESINHEKLNIEKFSNIIQEYVKFVVVEGDSHKEAWSVFDIINNRGKNLSSVDLLKNNIFRLIANENIDDVEITKKHDIVLEKWKKLDILNENGKEIDTFIRHWLLSKKDKYKYTNIIKNRISDRFEDILKNNENIMDLVDDLSKSSELYLKLYFPERYVWSNNSIYNQKIKNILKEIKILGLAQVTVMLLPLFMNDKIHDKLKYDCCKLLRNFVFQFSTLSKRSGNRLETIYCPIALEFSKPSFNFQDISSRLYKHIGDEEGIIISYETLNYNSSNIEKLILFYENKYMSSGNDSEAIDLSKFQLEHIIPKKWTSNNEWVNFFKNKNISDEEVEDIIESHGNKTLLLGKKNIQNSNNFFTEKKKIFSEQTIPICNSLIKYDNFDISTIQNRSIELLKYGIFEWAINDLQKEKFQKIINYKYN